MDSRADALTSSGELMPFVSIVIPAYNCASILERCLASVCAQTYPRCRYDIVVVDDGSIDGTADVARSLARGWGGRLTVVRKANGGPGSARDAGIAATGADVDVIAFIDADCAAESNWLECLVGRLVASGAAGIGGPLLNVAAPGWVSSYLQAANFYRHRLRNGKVDYLVTANVAFWRSDLLAVGGFSKLEGVWCEDADLSFRFIQSGRTLVLASEGSVVHYGSPTSVRRFMRELYWYGFGSGILARDWPRARKPSRQFIRHLGALVLSPVLALSHARRAGLLRALSFCPLIAVEHASFCVGLGRAAMWPVSEMSWRHLV
jgi:glycosyltransferase involved in cell wall biosynthesis